MFENMDYKKITINPRIINHLGRDLITTSDVAIVELVKNSIDARANCVNLHIFENDSHLKQCANFVTPLSEGIMEFLPDYCLNKSFIVVEDNGKGMNNGQLDKGFLEIGTGIKLDDLEDTTLGEKGIGRLAAQRLGKYLLVETASKDENYATLTFINWEDIAKPNERQFHDGNYENYKVPHKRINKAAGSYTRLWIFDINISDFIDTPAQIVIDIGLSNPNIIVNSNLKSAINFLISPYEDSAKIININMFYNNRVLDISFPQDMLELSESTHSFWIYCDGTEIELEYSLSLEPWFIERVHRVLVKPETFKRLKKDHMFYKELLENNKDRIENVLSDKIDEAKLIEVIAEMYQDFYSVSIKDKKRRFDYARMKATRSITSLKKILPIKGKIHTFKQNTAIGQNIIIDSLQEIYKDNNKYSLKDLKLFLDNYNGIKLYRGIYRIGFLGDKENDWIKLQQFRTKGQQWYRFDLGNTLGYVSINDPEQTNIQEISSRLDISQNDVSDALKDLINIIFNRLFYDINRKSNSIIRVILEEKGLLGERLTNRVEKNTSNIKRSIRKNKLLAETMQKITSQLEKDVKIDGQSVYIPLKTYNILEQVFKETSEHFTEDEKTRSQALNLLEEADEQLKAIKVESYNNYKLMANGLITETITHELHSISKTGIESNINNHFDYLKDYFIDCGAITMYNKHLYPIKNNYDVVSNKLNEVGNLYSFLENTFVKKGTYDEFVNQNVNDVITDIRNNLLKVIQDNKITIHCKTGELTWFVPKGVLIHVFYNLINNSIYWIDKRRKFAETDKGYYSLQDDKILIEEYSLDSITVHDTGTGIISKMEDILFEPLESGKPGGEGRGMGLYIVKQLLNSFNADIELLPDRNDYGNRYKFLITLEVEEIYQNEISTLL